MKRTFLLHLSATSAESGTIAGNRAVELDSPTMTLAGIEQARREWAEECTKREFPISASDVIICNIMEIAP